MEQAQVTANSEDGKSPVGIIPMQDQSTAKEVYDKLFAANDWPMKNADPVRGTPARPRLELRSASGAILESNLPLIPREKKKPAPAKPVETPAEETSRKKK